MERQKLPSGKIPKPNTKIHRIEVAITIKTAPIQMKFALATCGSTTINKNLEEVAGITLSVVVMLLSTCLTEERFNSGVIIKTNPNSEESTVLL